MYEYNPIPCLERLGYTEREASFLYLVGRNSGYFLRRQFLEFAQGHGGALAQNFVNKGLAYGDITTFDYGQRRHIYHLRSGEVYKVLAMEDTRQGRLKGDHEIATRLLILDYLLGQLQHRWLSTEAEKVEYFEKELNVDPQYFPRASASAANENGTPGRYFPDRFPVASIPEKPESRAQVRFTFFDAGSATVKAFERYLASYRELFLRLPRFELVYVSFAPDNFPQAERVYERVISQPRRASRLLPQGAEHLVRFLRSQDLWERKEGRVPWEDLLIFEEGERIYTQPEHAVLRVAWRKGSAAYEQELTRLGLRHTATRKLATQLIQRSYPVFGFNSREKKQSRSGQASFQLQF